MVVNTTQVYREISQIAANLSDEHLCAALVGLRKAIEIEKSWFGPALNPIRAAILGAELDALSREVFVRRPDLETRFIEKYNANV